MQLIAQFSEPPDKNLPYAAGCVWILWINKKINKNNAQTLSWPYSAEAENSIEKFAVHFRLRVRKPRGGERKKGGGGGECKMGWSPARPETGGVDQQGNAFESNMAFSFPFAQFGDSFNYSVSFCPFSCYILVCI